MYSLSSVPVPGRGAVGGGLSLFGAALLAVPLYHAIDHPGGDLALVLGVVVPALMALSVVVAGAWLPHRLATPTQVARVFL